MMKEPRSFLLDISYISAQIFPICVANLSVVNCHQSVRAYVGGGKHG